MTGHSRLERGRFKEDGLALEYRPSGSQHRVLSDELRCPLSGWHSGHLGEDKGLSHLVWNSSPPSPPPAGLKNWVVAEDVVFKPVAAPWSPEHHLQRPQLTRQVLGREDLTAFSLGKPLPRYLYLAANQTNAWGHQRGYRIQIYSPLGIHMPLESDMERALSWGR